MLLAPYEAPAPGFSGSPEQGHSTGPAEHIGSGLRDRETRQQHEASDLAGINCCGQVSRPPGSVGSVQQARTRARPGQSGQRWSHVCAAPSSAGDLGDTAQGLFPAPFWGFRKEPSSTLHYLLFFAVALFNIFYFPLTLFLTAVMLISFPFFVHFHVTNRNPWLD